jgi:predicted RNA binding protein with dsRBD fold (UPF0201 family)
MPDELTNPKARSIDREISIDLKRRDFFVLIGAMKAGTTSFAKYLGLHNKVFMANPKEPQFFSRDEVYQLGIEWYAELFAGAGPEHTLGEASTCYSRRLQYPFAAERLHTHLPNARLIYVLRHPVDRLYSNYVYHLQGMEGRQGADVMSIDEFLREFEDAALDAGNYIAQIEHYLHLFEESRLKCLLYDDIFSTSSKVVTEVIRNVFTFLGLEYTEVGDLRKIRENSRGTYHAKHTINSALSNIRERFPAKQVVDVLPSQIRSSLRHAAVRFLLNSQYGSRQARRFVDSVPRLSPTARRALCQHYRPSVLKLEEFLGRRLRHWLE